MRRIGNPKMGKWNELATRGRLGPCELHNAIAEAIQDEWRRIRRAQAKAMRDLWAVRLTDNEHLGLSLEAIWNQLDAATKSPKRGRR